MIYTINNYVRIFYLSFVGSWDIQWNGEKAISSWNTTLPMDKSHCMQINIFLINKQAINSLVFYLSLFPSLSLNELHYRQHQTIARTTAINDNCNLYHHHHRRRFSIHSICIQWELYWIQFQYFVEKFIFASHNWLPTIIAPSKWNECANNEKNE